jgi:hypothetical protein
VRSLRGEEVDQAGVASQQGLLETSNILVDVPAKGAVGIYTVGGPLAAPLWMDKETLFAFHMPIFAH